MHNKKKLNKINYNTHNNKKKKTSSNTFFPD